MTMEKRHMRLAAVLLFICSVAINEACAQSEAPLTHEVILTVSIASDRHEFHIGEIIPLQLSFTSPVNDRYQVNMAQYDRSGRMEQTKVSSIASPTRRPYGSFVKA
jgi:hypothetical protein